MADSLVTPEPVWALLMGQPRLIAHAKVQDALGAGGFLGQALQRLPDDPRLRLAEVEAIEAIQTRCTELFCHDEMTPAALNDLRTRANTPGPTNESVGCKDSCWVFSLLRRIHDSAVANLTAFDRLLAVAGEFAKLADRYPSVRAEAHVHIGYLAIRAARPDAAIEPLATAATSDDPYVAYLAAQFTGRALEMLERRADAMAAYRRALAIVPNAPSTATLLAAQLFLSDNTGDREEAHAVLEAAGAASPRPADPWDRYWQGDARLWSIYIERLRTGLRQ
jgi:tetratricopeptide (TPR) repeat protein